MGSSAAQESVLLKHYVLKKILKYLPPIFLFKKEINSFNEFKSLFYKTKICLFNGPGLAQLHIKKNNLSLKKY